MLKFKTISGDGWVENSWDELNSVQFVETCSITNQFFAGKFDIDEYRLRLLEMLTGYKRKTKRNEMADQINENLFLISEQLTFAVMPQIGPEEVLEFFSPELRELLKTRFPWEIFEPEHVQQLLTVKGLLKIGFSLNFDLTRNLLPQVSKGNKVYKGFYFDTVNGDIKTNLTAEQYLDASEYFNAYSEDKNPGFLASFINCLYHKRSTPHSKDIPSVDDKKTKDAIVMVFMYIQKTFLNDPIFKILFTEEQSSGSMAKLNLGSSEAILQVVEEGYGSLNEVKKMNILDFFNTQIMILKKHVAQLRAMDKKAGEISKEMNLSIDVINQL
jgi:hypothetical protein